MMPPLSAFAAYGIELEYMIVDRATLDVRPIADAILCDEDGTPRNEIERGALGCSNELVLHVLELKSLRPTADLEGLLPQLQAELRWLNDRLQDAGAQLMPTAMHPWFDPVADTRLWPHERAEIYATYDRIFDCRRHAQANIQSMQINLPFADDHEFARLHAAVRLVLPIIPALAASSPFADGRWRGCLDFRMALYGSQQLELPATMGELIPESIASRAEYEARILEPIYRGLAAVDPDGILAYDWVNMRAAVARFDRQAIEIRVVDAQECPFADLAVAAAIIAVVRALYDGRESENPPLGERALLQILRACISDGEQARIDDAAYLERMRYPGRQCLAGELWQHLIEGMASDLVAWLPALHLILERGPLARRLLRAVGAKPSRSQLGDVYRELCACLNAGRLFLGPD